MALVDFQPVMQVPLLAMYNNDKERYGKDFV
ncbi:hypothetical protein CUZ56_01711 [Saezia sanguinis]|uniref:Uncharacterized protein n=1 Tax=Saezia sanguinis TaxID=1965230 RepID=A0A433SDZ9_9BURK|nr:hypothetical protein CUZ56_01711 [Saezia sanguinis]